MAKEWTEEERKVFGEKMKAARNEQTKPTKEVKTSQEEEKVTLTKEQFDALMSRLESVENVKTTSTTPISGFDQFGKPTGIIQRYNIDPSHYTSPVDRLYDIQELKREALRENYELIWDVDQIVYETKYGTSFADPKFSIVLKRKVYDGGELTDRRIIIQTGVFFEDPAASVKEAIGLGLPINNSNTPEFLEQMRYLRYKQWLLDIFNPQLPKSTKAQAHDEVIDGKVYSIEDYSVVV